MAVNQQRDSGREAGRHGLGIAWIELDENEALPGRSIAFGSGPELVEEGFLEFQDLPDMHADDARFGGSNRGIDKNDVFELVGAGRKDGGTFVDLGGIEEVEDGEVLDLEDLVHALDGEAALAVEEIGNVGLFESGLLGEAESGEFPGFDSLLNNFPEVVLQGLELH